jgi:TctA family transporter
MAKAPERSALRSWHRCWAAFSARWSFCFVTGASSAGAFFSSPNFFILTLWGVSMVGILSGNAPIKAFSPAFWRIYFHGWPGREIWYRALSFNVAYFWEGIDLVLVALGIFAIPEVIDLAGRKGAIAKAEEFGSGYARHQGRFHSLVA